MKPALVLCLPGLLPDPAWDLDMHRFPALCTLLSRATMVSHDVMDVEGLMKKQFTGLGPGPIAAGAIGAYQQGITQKEDEWWCRADPIVTLLDHQTAYLADNSHLKAETQHQFVQDLKHFLKDDPIQLFDVKPNEWYCKVTDHTQVQMSDLWQLWGKSLLQAWPQGKDAAYWRRLLTEVQMLLLQKQTEISSLWFWGLGQLPQSITTQFNTVYSDDSVIGGLAKLAQVSVQVLPSHLQASDLNGKHILLMDLNAHRLKVFQDLDQWQQLLIMYEENWFKPILQLLKQGFIEKVTIMDEKHEWTLSKRHLWYFWRRGF